MNFRTVSDSKTPMPRWQVWLIVSVLLGMLGTLFGMSFLDEYLSGAPDGFRSEISVIAYVDDSDIGKLQKSAVEQLSIEYSGAIEFQVIDASVTPELAVSPKLGAIKQFPSISIIKFGYNKDGEYYFSSDLTTVALTKQQIIDHIESIAKSPRRFWPDTPIKRSTIP